MVFFHQFNVWLGDKMVTFFVCLHAPAFMVFRSPWEKPSDTCGKLGGIMTSEVVMWPKYFGFSTSQERISERSSVSPLSCPGLSFYIITQSNWFVEWAELGVIEFLEFPEKQHSPFGALTLKLSKRQAQVLSGRSHWAIKLKLEWRI